MRTKLIEWSWAVAIGLIVYVGWTRYILPYKLAVEQHAAVIAQIAQIRINPDRTLTWIGELPKPSPTSTPPAPQAKAEKK